MIRKNKEIWAGIFLFLFASIFFLQALRYEYLGPLGPGPGFFSSWISGFLAIFSLIYIYQSYKKDKVVEKEEDQGEENNHSYREILYTIGCMLFYLFTVNYLGFVLTTTIFLFALLFKEYKWYVSLGIAIFTSIIIFLLFSNILRVSLPVNGLGW